MNYFTTAQWAQTCDMSMGDIEQCLMELGYQTLDTLGQLKWKLTEKGMNYAKKSMNPFNPTLRWNFEAFFDAIKHYGRKTRRHFYCSECGEYLNEQHAFSTTMDKWTCKSCGCVSDLDYESFCANKLAKKYEDVLGRHKKVYKQSKVSDVHCKCSQCNRIAHGIDEINVIFGFVRTNDGKLKPQKICKMCRSK